jgi:anaerobic nitric oxide reductase transcription regulator
MIGRSAFKALSRHRERPRILTLTAADLGMSANNGGELPAAASLSASTGADDAAATDFRSTVTAYERTLVSDALERNNHNWAAVARALGMDRANLNRLARRLGLK